MNSFVSKRIATTIALLGALLLGAVLFFFLPTPASAACPPGTLEYPGGSGTCLNNTGCVPTYMARSTPGGECDVDTRRGIGNVSNNGTPAAEALSCDSFIGNGFKCAVAKFFYYIVYTTVGTLLTIAAAFLDVVINTTILKFSDWITAVTGVRVAWTILRDVMNITFIFMLLYASISMILGNGKEKGIIKGVIVAGLFINFSFFFTSVIIDVSNVPTVEMFKGIQRIGEKYKGAPVLGDTLATADGITNVFMQGLGVQTQSEKGLSPDGEDVDSHIFQQLVFSTIAILVIAFVFFAMAFLLLGRFIILLILLITSPISVMGGVLPQLAEHSKKWWKTLIDQAVFAPIMMLFMLVTALIVSNPSFKEGLTLGADKAVVNVPFSDGIAGMINYAIVIGLLVTGMVTAKKSAGGASKALTDFATKTAGKAAFGLGARGLQNTVGLAGSKLGSSALLSNIAVNSKSAWARSLAGGALRSGSYVGDRTFDVRGTPIGSELGAGKAIKNRADRIKEEAKKREERQTRYAENAARLPGSQKSPGEIELEKELSNLDVRNNELAEKLKETEKKKADFIFDIDKDKADKEIKEIKRQMEEDRKKTETRRAEIEKELGKERRNRPERNILQNLLASDEVSAARKELVKSTKKLTAAQIRQARDINKEAIEIKDDKKRTIFLQNNLSAEQKKYLDASNILKITADEVGARKKDNLEYVSSRDAQSIFASKQAAADSIRKKEGRGKEQRLADDIIQALLKKDEGKAPDKPAE